MTSLFLSLEIGRTIFFSEEITEESIYLGDDKFNFYKTAFEMPVNTHLELSR